MARLHYETQLKNFKSKNVILRWNFHENSVNKTETKCLHYFLVHFTTVDTLYY